MEAGREGGRQRNREMERESEREREREGGRQRNRDRERERGRKGQAEPQEDTEHKARRLEHCRGHLWNPSPSTLPSAPTTTAPTHGFGAVILAENSTWKVSGLQLWAAFNGWATWGYSDPTCRLGYLAFQAAAALWALPSCILFP